MLQTSTLKAAEEFRVLGTIQIFKGEHLKYSLRSQNDNMQRNEVKQFRDIPNVGPAIEKDLIALGLNTPAELIGKDPYQMYAELCVITQKRQDPCVIDVFISAVRYMEGGPVKKWWEFTEERKRYYGI